MKAQLMIFTFLILFIIPLAVAKTDYNESGHIDSFYQAGTGIFNSELTTDTLVPKILTDGKLLPLVADLDNDTINEIVVFDDADIILYSTSALNQIFRLELGISGRISNAIIFDVDENDFPDIIFALDDTELLHFLEYNGTIFTNVSTIDLSDIISHDDGQMMVKCGKEGNCLLAVSERADNSAESLTNVSAYGFNKTTVAEGVELQRVTGGSVENVCFPNIRNIVYNDYDQDGTTEYIFNAMKLSKGVEDDEFSIYFVVVNDSLSASEDMNEITVTTDSSVIDSNPASCVDDNAGSFFSSPLVFDINAPTDRREIMMALIVAPNKFAIQAWKSDGSFLNSYPALCRPFFAWANCAVANFVSNVFRADIFEGQEGVDDVCAIGYNDNGNDIICGSERSLQAGLFKTMEISMITPHNITSSYNNYNAITHAGDYIDTTTANDDGSLKDLPEFINSFGVIEITRTPLTSTASISFPNPQRNTVLIPVDVEKTNAEDFLLLDATNFFYLDDGLSNRPAIITNIEFNPCPIDSVLKNGTLMNIFVTVTDQNNALLGQDTVSSSVKMYQGSAFEFNDSISDVVSGALQPYQFVLNETITGGNIRIEGWDSANTDDRDRIDTDLNVQVNGIEFGDSECELAFVAEEDEVAVVDEATLTVDATENAITSGINTFIGFTGLAGATIWLLFMMFGAYFIYSTMAERNMSGNSALGTIAIVEVLAIIIGVRIGVLSAGLVVTIVVIGIVIIGVFLGKMFRGDSTSG